MDTTTIVVQAINGWLVNVASTITPPALRAAGSLFFHTPAFTEMPEVQRLWQITAAMADIALVLLLMGGGAMVMSSGTFGSIYSLKRLLPRLALAAILSNASLALCGSLVELANALTAAMVGTNPDATLWVQLSNGLLDPAPGSQVLSALIAIAVAVMAVALVLVSIGRDLILLVATIVAPLPLSAYGLPQVDDVARLWGRVYAAALFVQVLQVELVNVGLQLVQHTAWLGTPVSPLIDALTLVALLYVILRLPLVAYRWAFNQAGSATRAIRAAVEAGLGGS
jgi:hypothetical protein